MKECITHHYACGCRETATKDLILNLFGILWGLNAMDATPIDLTPLLKYEAEAEKLGYIKL